MRKKRLMAMARAEMAKGAAVLKQRRGMVARRRKKTTRLKTISGTWMMISTLTNP